MRRTPSKGNKLRTAVILLLLLSMAAANADGLFTADERANIVKFWNAPGRRRVGPLPDTAQRGPWQVRLTPEGSTWLLKYQIAAGSAAAPPTQEATAAVAPTDVWKSWVRAKIDYDRWQAQQTADAANAALKPAVDPAKPADPALQAKPADPVAPAKAADPAKQTDPPHQDGSAVAPPAPGPIPADLLAATGNPPAFASAVAPLLTTVTFDDGETLNYPSHIALPKSFAYYRFPQGTVAYGPRLTDLPQADVDALFKVAGMTPSEQRIAFAVSKLEGGFESVNTYDTGYVSVGFIQFITHEDGKHSLAEVLLREKTEHADDFAHDFHAFGLDVTPDGVFTAVDPATGAELAGAEAVRKTVDDKRLVAVFQRAGRHSMAFRAAQIEVAKAHYWPTEDTFTITVNGQMVTGKVSDVISSEAGIATLFDRKVNRGSIKPFEEVLAKVMTAHNVTQLKDVVPYEKEIVAALKYRTDYLQDPTLSQPN
ncbi:MAG: hypothetical protein JWL77_89 [Chthonomonadaceae bacterium]|nr:hypothetical protein [Chthonomonadaceae bacterium]